MAPRKASTKTAIDPVTLAAAALKAIKTAADYYRVHNTTESETFKIAWSQLSNAEQNRIDSLVTDNEVDIHVVANELSACGSKIQLEAVKAEYGDVAVKIAWKLLPQVERDRIKTLCNNEHQSVEETPQPVTEESSVHKVEPQQTKRSLFDISQEMHSSSDELEVRLDSTDDPDEQIQLIELWLQQNAGVQSEMLERVNAYLWVIRKQKAQAEYRATEGKRLKELAEHSENLAKRLENQLLQFMDAHNLGKLETKDFKVSPRHASTEPLIVNEDFSIDQVPEEFIVVSKTINRKLTKEAIKAGQQLPFAVLGTKSRYLYIR